MTEKLQQTIKEEVGKLPKETQDAINSLNWENITEGIGKNFSLSEEEINDLQIETLLVLVGITDVNYYDQNIEENVGLTEETSEKIAEEVFQRVFTPLAEILEENIKKNLKNKNPNWKQNLNFVLSGGDYSAFVDKGSDIMNSEVK